jgi:hypothetical protein
MAGENIIADTIEEGKKQIIEIYKRQSIELKEITKEQYESYQLSERTDSDNHLQLERLGKGTKVIDQAFYKYLPEPHHIIYKINLIHEDGQNLSIFLDTVQKENL